MSAGEHLTLLVTLDARPGCGDRLREALVALAASSRADPGCVRYDVLEETASLDRFVLVEEWLDDASHVEHDAQQHVVRFREGSAALIAGRIAVRRLRRTA